MAGCILKRETNPHWPGFDWCIEIDDAVDPAKRSGVWAAREEIQIISRAKAGAT